MTIILCIPIVIEVNLAHTYYNGFETNLLITTIGNINYSHAISFLSVANMKCTIWEKNVNCRRNRNYYLTLLWRNYNNKIDYVFNLNDCFSGSEILRIQNAIVKAK